MFRSIQTKFAHHALNTIRVFTQSDEVKHLLCAFSKHLRSRKESQKQILRRCAPQNDTQDWDGVLTNRCCAQRTQRQIICASRENFQG
jgi:hypothetical protein